MLITAAESRRAQRRAAGGLRRAGVGLGDRVLLSLPPSAELLAIALGALRSGSVPVMVDPARTAGERAELVADADAALVVTEPAALLDGPEAELADVPLARPMHYTSGTSGRRKGVWTGVLDEPAARALFDEEAALWEFDPADRHLVLGPLHHSAPLRFAMHTLLAGGSVLLRPRFDRATVLADIAEFRPTTAFCAPTHLKRMFAATDLPPLGSFRLLAHAGEACPAGLKRRVIEAFPAGSAIEFYGSTEAQFTVCRPDEWLAHPGTVGRARPGRRLTADGDGIIWCEVPAYARFSYWRDPSKTAAAWRGAELTVRDTGRLEDGYLYLDGRRDDLIITGGVNVYPLEVERVLGTCPGVRECVVFGVEDEQWGQRVTAAVVGTATAAELTEFARARLAPGKRPKSYHLVPELPVPATGKISRRSLPTLLDLP